MIPFILFVFGVCFGSFVNAYVWRTHMAMKKSAQKNRKQYSILQGRSMCPDCKHTLAARDLIPVVSWLLQGGTCRYCHKQISKQYPLVEILTGVLFVWSYLAWPGAFSVIGWAGFGIWLALVVQLVALAAYDLKWMLLPNRMVAVAGVLSVALLATRLAAAHSVDPLLDALWGALIAGGLFYVLFQISAGRWIGGGDVKLGAVLGIIVGGPMNAILLLFMASFAGTLVTLPLLMTGKAKRTSKLPFGPFLIMGAYLTVLYGQRLVDWYNTILL